MQIHRTKHAHFFENERLALEASYQDYLNATPLSLLESRQLFRAQVVGFDSTRGNLILKFRKGQAPRLQEPLIAFTITSELADKTKWREISYLQLRATATTGSSVTPVFYMTEDEPDFVQMGFAHAELRFTDKIKAGTLLILGREEPPIEYLSNLKKLVETISSSTPAGKILDFDFHQFNWSPTSMTSAQLTEAAVRQLLTNDTMLVQGPPGTGKTYLLATICAHYLQLGATILVVSMANRALIELAEKESLNNWLSIKKIRKTNLSLTEQKKVSQLQSWESFEMIEQNAIHLTTYFKMSSLALNPSVLQQFDLVIVEEASQAYLATLAAARRLAKKMLIVGDPLQLRPTVLQNLELNSDGSNSIIINGFESLAQQYPTDGFRLIETHRLSPKASLQTGVFYDDQLQSISNFHPLTGTHPFAELFDPLGGTSIWYTKECDHRPSTQSSKLIYQIISDFHQHHPTLQFAVLTAYKESSKQLQEYILPRFKKTDWLTIETIDRVQGMTCDLCIFLIPHASTAFAVDPNRFNVATSRARLGTLILTHPDNQSAFRTNPQIRAFVETCRLVNLSYPPP